MHALVIGLAAALGVSLTVSVVLLVLLGRRTSRRADARVASVVNGLEGRMEELAGELTQAIRTAEEESRRSSFLAQIGGTMELDDVLGATLEAARTLPGVDAALVQLDGGGGEAPLVTTAGFEGEEPNGVGLFRSPESWSARAVELSFRYGSGSESAGAVHTGLGVPLLDPEGRIGWLGVFSRSADARLGDQEVRRLEELAERVGPAIENARRFREARRLADLDALTGLHNRRYFHETLAREVARSLRYKRRLSLLIADLDGFKEINDRIGHLAGDAVLAETAERLRQVVRAADVPCRVGGDEFAVIVPEAGLDDARRLAVRIQQAMLAKPVARAGRVRISAGVAELQADDDPTSLFERADESLYSAKGAGRSAGGLVAAD